MKREAIGGLALLAMLCAWRPLSAQEMSLSEGFTQAQGAVQAQGQRLDDARKWWHEHTEGAPYTGRHRIIFIPPAWGNALGQRVYKGMIDKYKAQGLVDNDPQGVALLKGVCDRLIAVADQPQLPWEYHLIDTGTVNAFAIAGGKIGVLKGILKYTEDEMGLAVVLGHETGHVVARHLDERLSELILLQAGMIAGGAVLPVILPATIPAAVLNMANMVATINQIYQLGSYEGMRLGMMGFSRAQEAEADHIGLILMAKAGYDPLKAVDFWMRMHNAYPDPKNIALVKYWRSHPPTTERIANIVKWAPNVREKYYHPTPNP